MAGGSMKLTEKAQGAATIDSYVLVTQMELPSDYVITGNEEEGELDAMKIESVRRIPTSEIVELVQDNLEIDDEPTDESDALITSGSVKAELDRIDEALSSQYEDLNGVAISDGCIIYHDGTFSSDSSSNWPARTFYGMVSKWSGAFSTVANYFYSDLLCPVKYGITKGAVTETLSLTSGHTYSVEANLLSGNITGQSADVCVDGVLTIAIGEKKVFTYNGIPFKFFFRFSGGVALNDAVISVIIKDITEKENNGATQKLLSGYVWRQGKHVTRNDNVETITNATDTMTLMGSIPYDPNMYFILSDGWKAQFVSVENGVVVGTSLNFIETSGRIDMIDVYNNLGYNSVHVFGDSLCINIRKTDGSVISPETVNVDDALQMYVVNQNGDATKPKTWIAIGDSITDGRFSQSDGTTVRTKTNHFCQYGYIASKLLGIESYVEQGYGGMGYVQVANDGTYLADVLALDFGSPDIITVCLGINDRSKTLGDRNSEANDGTISGSIRNCCEVLGNKYKNSQIIFLTPLNGCSTGTIDTGWCKRSGPTHLSDIADMIKYWANLYGFAVVDMLNSSPINDFNIQSLILDGLHPTMEAHYMVGRYLAGELPYRTC